MNVRSPFPAFILAAALSASVCAVAASSGPDSRTLTDPKTVSSQSNSAAKPVAIDDLFEITGIGRGAWSPNGQEIAFTSNASGRLNVWKMRADGSGATQLTKSDDRQSNLAWSPDGKWIVYAQDRGGNEIWDLYAIPSVGGAPMNLTSTDQIAENQPLFSPDGSKVAITYKPKESPITDIAILDWRSRQVHKLTNEQKPQASWSPVAWSHDGKHLLASRRSDPVGNDADVFLIDLATGNAENLTQHQGQQLIVPTDLSPDGKTVLLVSNAQGGYDNVALLDVATKKLRWVTNTQWEATPESFSPDGKQFTYSVNEDGRIHAWLAPTTGGQGRQLTLPVGLILFGGNPTAFSPDGKKILVSHQGSRHPTDLWAYDIASNQAQQLTHAARGSLDPNSLPQSQIVHYKSFDGTMISAILWVPFNLKRDGSNPAIVLPHGGPTGQTVDYFNREAAALASRGYICIAPHVRGSTGYGLKFMQANIKDLGGGDLQDEVYAVKFLTASGYADPK